MIDTVDRIASFICAFSSLYVETTGIGMAGKNDWNDDDIDMKRG
jgi:hypothetical protein